MADLQKAANNVYVKADYLLLIVFYWGIDCVCLTTKLLLLRHFESQAEHQVASSLTKPPNASKSDLVNAGRNLYACRLVTVIIPPYSHVKSILHYSIVLGHSGRPFKFSDHHCNPQ